MSTGDPDGELVLELPARVKKPPKRFDGELPKETARSRLSFVDKLEAALAHTKDELETLERVEKDLLGKLVGKIQELDDANREMESLKKQRDRQARRLLEESESNRKKRPEHREWELQTQLLDGKRREVALLTELDRASQRAQAIESELLAFREERQREAALREELESAKGPPKPASDPVTERLAFMDPLTGLPNQNLIDKVLETEFPRALQSKQELVYMVADLDHFGRVNDRVGYDWGDHLLRQIASELRASLPEDVIVGRRGEDEFVITYFGPEARGRSRFIGQQVWNVVAADREAGGRPLFQRACIGISAAPGFAQSPADLKKQTDEALNFAKESGRGRLYFYDQELRNRRAQEKLDEAAFYEAALSGEVQTLYQPIVDLSSGKLEGVELSLYWEQAPEESRLMRLVDRCNLGVHLGDELLGEACRVARDLGRKVYVVSPILPGQIVTEDCTRRCLRKVESYKVAPKQVCLQDLDFSGEEYRERLLDQIARWGFGLVYREVAHLLDTADRWPNRPRRFLRIPPEWTAHAPLTEPGNRISVGLIHLADVAQAHSVAAGVSSFEQAQFFSLADCRAGSGPYFGVFKSADELNPKARWTVRTK